MRTSRTFSSLLASLLLFGASTAYAQATVVVLGIRSIEGDDDVANDLTVQLRMAATSVDEWSVSEQAVSMAQMSLAHGCDEIDAACLKDIAAGLHADSIIFGTMRRNSARDDYDFSVSLSLFDAGTGGIERDVDDTLPRDETDTPSLARRAEKLIRRLTASEEGSAISIQVNVDVATVSVNGQQVGKTREGTLRLEGLQPGDYVVEVSAPGYEPHETTLSVSRGGEAQLAAALRREGMSADGEFELGSDGRRDGSGSDMKWLAYTLLGVSGASLIGAGVSALVVEGVNDDETFTEYKDAVARMNPAATDVCAEAEAGFPYGLGETTRQDVADMCSSADTFEVLQWVFLGTAVVSGGVGVYLLLADGGSESARADAEPRLVLQPQLGRDRAHLSATLRF